MKLINRILGIVHIIFAIIVIIFLISYKGGDYTIFFGVIPQILTFIGSLKYAEKLWLLIVNILVLLFSILFGWGMLLGIALS
jgi:hypothetical protein